MKRKHTPDFPPGWDWYEFEDEPTKEQIRYCRKHLKFLGEGSSRIVFQIDDLSVLKLATVNVGRHQNRTEYEIAQYSDRVCPVFNHEKEYFDWVISGYAKNITEGEFLELTENSWWLWKDNPNKCCWIAAELNGVILDFKLNPEEYNDLRQFGKYQNRIVIRDYGLTNDILRE